MVTASNSLRHGRICRGNHASNRRVLFRVGGLRLHNSNHSRRPPAGGPIAPGAQVLLIQSDIKFYVITAGGVSDHSPTGPKRPRNFVAATRRELAKHGHGLLTTDPTDVDDRLAQYQKLHDAVRNDPSGTPLPSKHGAFDYTLGPGVSFLKHRYGADYALFVTYHDARASGGQQAKAILAGMFGVYGVSVGGQSGFASLIDLATGDIVWCRLVGWVQATCANRTVPIKPCPCCSRGWKVADTLRAMTCAVICCAALHTLAAEAVPTIPKPLIPPGYRPTHERDERGLWLELEEYETAVMRSPLRIRDAALDNYVKNLVCRIGKDYCGDFRVYVLRNPYFNASMTANGMMQVWTGALTRVGSEDELATVIGHEIAHYELAHTLAQFRKIKKGMAIGSIFDIGLAVVGVPVPVGQMTAVLNVLAFSREEEEAEQICWALS